jgi:hypothetical protein
MTQSTEGIVEAEPSSVENARERLAVAVATLQDIEVQLGDRNRTIGGGRMEGDEYWEWRQRATRAKTATERQVRGLKAWLRINDPTVDYGVQLQAIDAKLTKVIAMLDHISQESS